MTMKKSPVATFLHSLSSSVGNRDSSGCEILGTLQAGVYRLPDPALHRVVPGTERIGHRSRTRA